MRFVQERQFKKALFQKKFVLLEFRKYLFPASVSQSHMFVAIKYINEIIIQAK